MPEFRKALPPGFMKMQTEDQLAQSTFDLLDGLRRNAQDKGFVRRFLAQAQSRRTKQGGPFRSDVHVKNAG